MRLALGLLLIGCIGAAAKPTATPAQPRETNGAPATANAVPGAARWHSIEVKPRPDFPKIHAYNKFNPLWWYGNLDEPVPPAWYRPRDKHREARWRLRNPFHNFDNYVIGVADKPITRSGRYPERNSSPLGGWDFEVARRKWAFLPFISYARGGFNFYLGWRERGNFGAKLNFSAAPHAPEDGTGAGLKNPADEGVP